MCGGERIRLWGAQENVVRLMKGFWCVREWGLLREQIKKEKWREEIRRCNVARLDVRG